MKKLFLTSFVFTTGGIEYKEYRLVVVTKADIQNYKDAHKGDTMVSDDPELSSAYEKFSQWFPQMFPESELISHIAHPAIL
jgi:hypothetical protein